MGMIFVRLKNGVSHSPDEWSSKEDRAAGGNLLYYVVLRGARPGGRGLVREGDKATATATFDNLIKNVRDEVVAWPHLHRKPAYPSTKTAQFVHENLESFHGLEYPRPTKHDRRTHKGSSAHEGLLHRGY
jgi:hypothetical protein